MGSFAEKPRARKTKLIGQAQTLTREAYESLARQERIALIRRLIPLGLMAVAEELQREVEHLVGCSVDVGTGKPGLRRFGTNPGSVILGNQRVPIRVPRVRGKGGEIALESYEMLHGDGDPQGVYQSILRGVSCRDYESTIQGEDGAISKSKSTVSRRFVNVSSKQLKVFQERELQQHDIVAIFIDGTPFADDQMVVALGITLEGKKVILGFVQAGTENTRAVSLFLRSLVDRGLSVEQGVLAVTDGSKGLLAGLKQAFAGKLIIQRCQWHKRENVVSHLAKTDQDAVRKQLQQAYERPVLEEAQQALKAISGDLNKVNQSAAASLDEGWQETLSLHRLGMFGKIGKSFKTSNCLESINASAEKYCGKIDHWINSSQKQRWLACALADIEPSLRRVKGWEHMPALRKAIKQELGI
jgi:putative transposase